MLRGLVVAAVISSLVAVGPLPGVAQSAGSRAGVVVGLNNTEQLWKPEAEVERAVGLVLGAFLDAATPLSGFTILAEGSYTQRGVDVGIGGGRSVGVEGRVFEGLSDAYSGDFVSLRNRSWEAVVRFGIPLRR